MAPDNVQSTASQARSQWHHTAEEQSTTAVHTYRTQLCQGHVQVKGSIQAQKHVAQQGLGHNFVSSPSYNGGSCHDAGAVQQFSSESSVCRWQYASLSGRSRNVCRQCSNAHTHCIANDITGAATTVLKCLHKALFGKA